MTRLRRRRTRVPCSARTCVRRPPLSCAHCACTVKARRAGPTPPTETTRRAACGGCAPHQRIPGHLPGGDRVLLGRRAAHRAGVAVLDAGRRARVRRPAGPADGRTAPAVGVPGTAGSARLGRRADGGLGAGRRAAGAAADPGPYARPLGHPPGSRLLPLPRGGRRGGGAGLGGPAGRGRGPGTGVGGTRPPGGRGRNPPVGGGRGTAPVDAAHPYNADHDGLWHEVRRLLRVHRYAREALGEDVARPAAAGEALDRHRDAAEAATASATAARTPRIAPATAYALGVLHADQRHEVEAARLAFQHLWLPEPAVTP